MRFKSLLDRSILRSLKKILIAILRTWNEIFPRDLKIRNYFLKKASRVLSSIDLVILSPKSKQLRAWVMNLEWCKIIVSLRILTKMIKWELVIFLSKTLKSMSTRLILHLGRRLIMINYLSKWGTTTCTYSNYETNTSLKNSHPWNIKIILIEVSQRCQSSSKKTNPSQMKQLSMLQVNPMSIYLLSSRTK